MMIVAHQKQIEELRESFRQKSSDTEQWSQKVICAPSSGASAFLCIQSMCKLYVFKSVQFCLPVFADICS